MLKQYMYLELLPLYLVPISRTAPVLRIDLLLFIVLRVDTKTVRKNIPVHIARH